MARKKVLFIPIIVQIFLNIISVQCSKLNVPRVLLPIFNDFSSNFTLEVTEGGCYKWTTSRLDLVQLIPLDLDDIQDCSSKVVVATISKERTRNTAIVLAEDIYTGQVLRCDVIVDVIASLNIITTTRELFMEEAPEAFEVRATDDQGNEFTTLQGVEFEWTLANPENTVLRFITFRDSPYETPPSIEAFEEMGKQGHIVLLEGVKTGSAKVSVHLPHFEYKRLEPIEVSLMVIANLIIEPSDIYILRGDVVHYKIIQVKHGRLEEIQLPSEQYYLVSQNPDVGLIEKNSGYLTGLNIGRTHVYLHDNNVKEETGLKLPSATLHVQYPGRITLSLLPHRNWAVQVGDQHDIVVEVFTSDDHKIHLGEGVNLRTILDETYFSPSFMSSNGSFVSGTAIEQGTMEIKTTLLSVMSATLGSVNLDPKLTAKAQMLIFPKITLNPAEVILPWDPVARPRYDIEIKASGGDGKFLWSTTNHTIGVVTQTGFVRTQWHGQFDVCASMVRNHHNRQCAKFHIIPPSKLEIVDFIMEAEVGTPIFLHVALYGDRPSGGTFVQIPFTKCNDVPFEIKSSDSNFFHNKTAVTDPVGISCTSIAMESLMPGNSRITVQYKDGEIHLEQTVSIAAYRPLKLLNPDLRTILALGTQRNVIFTGGPRPWPGRPSDHIIELKSSQPNIVESFDTSDEYKVVGGSDTYVIRVKCKEIGESTITLTVYNKPLMEKCKHVKSVATATVICANPYFMHLQPEIKVPDKTSCPMDLSAERVIVQSYSNIDLLVHVKDSYGRPFDNITSLQFAWEVNPSNLASVQNRDGVYEKVYLEENVILPNKSYQIVKPDSQKGTIDVQAVITGYRTTDLRKSNIRLNPLIEPVAATITLILVDDTTVVPNRTSIYNHPLNKRKLKVLQGSGYNELMLSSHDIAEVKYNEALREIELTPKQTGELQISVKDLCLMSPPVIVTINVVYVAAVRVEVPDRVEIGKCIPCVVRFYDEFDNLMPLPKLDYLDIRHSTSEKIVSLKIAEENVDEPWPVGEVHYVIAGQQLGETKLVFAAGRGEKEITSSPVDIQVFAPLRIFPKNATLLIGSVLQLTTQGGPQPDTNIEFTIDSKNIAEINSNGVIKTLSLGHTKITGKSVSINPATGRKIINSQDSIDIHVIPLMGIKLTAPLTRFVQGTTVPIWVTGLPEKLSPLLLGSMDPPFQYSWGTRCSDIITLHGIFSSVGVADNSYNKVSVRAKGTRPGTCTIELNVTIPNGETRRFLSKRNTFEVYSATLEMEVIEALHLSSPKDFNGRAILLAPYSKLQLKTNKDGYSTLKYSVHADEQSTGNNKSIITTTRKLVSVNNQGVVTSHGNLGRAMIVITGVDEHGLKQTLNIIVQVKPVHYMLLTAETEWMVPIEENINVVPLGSQFQLIASYHDNTGAQFSAAQCDLFARTSRLDLLDVKRNSDNTSFTANSINDGPTVLKVWAENCFKTADYVQIYTGQIIKPVTHSLTSGDVLCMWSPVTTKTGQRGKWTAEPDNVIHLNPETGIGVVISSQSTKVFIQYDITPASKVVLNVEPVSEISFVYDHSKVLSNTNGDEFRVPLLFKDAENTQKTTNLFKGWECNEHFNHDITFHFHCNIEFDKENSTPSIYSVFSVTPAFNKDTGLYSCSFTPLHEPNENTSVIQSNVKLIVSSSNGIVSPTLSIKFYPGIYIPNHELIISESMTANLIITGLPEVLKQVTVVPYDAALVEVSSPVTMSPTVVNYEIRLIDYHWKLEELKDPMSVMVTSKLTNQNIKIQLKLASDKITGPFCTVRQMGSPLGNLIYENKQSIIILFSMLILFFVTFYAYSHYIQPVINVNVAPSGRSNVALVPRSAYNIYNQPIQGRAFSSGALLTRPYPLICPHISDRSMLLNQASPQMNNSNVRHASPCNSNTCPSRSLNTSGSPQMRYGQQDLTYRPPNTSPEVRRNRSFL